MAGGDAGAAFGTVSVAEAAGSAGVAAVSGDTFPMVPPFEMVPHLTAPALGAEAREARDLAGDRPANGHTVTEATR